MNLQMQTSTLTRDDFAKLNTYRVKSGDLRTSLQMSFNVIDMLKRVLNREALSKLGDLTTCLSGDFTHISGSIPAEENAKGAVIEMKPSEGNSPNGKPYSRGTRIFWSVKNFAQKKVAKTVAPADVEIGEDD